MAAQPARRRHTRRRLPAGQAASGTCSCAPPTCCDWDVDLIFYDITTAYFEIDEADEFAEQWAGKLYAAAAPARSQQRVCLVTANTGARLPALASWMCAAPA